jgi:hypothetical protein
MPSEVGEENRVPLDASFLDLHQAPPPEKVCRESIFPGSSRGTLSRPIIYAAVLACRLIGFMDRRA